MKKGKGKHRAEGSITVYLSLILLLILSLLFTIIEGARVSIAKVYAERALTTSMDAVFAEYYGPLWEEYHIFGLNSSGASDSEQKALMEAALMDYMSYTFEPEKDLCTENASGTWELYHISTDSLSVGNQVMLMDYQGQLLINQAVEYMKYKEMGTGIELLLDKLSLLETPEKVSYVYENKQKVEEELVEIDRGILELMELLDGLKTSKKGIELTGDGKLQTTGFYVKKICYAEVTKETVGINHDSIFMALKDSYVNPQEDFNRIDTNLNSMEAIIKRLEEINASIEATEACILAEQTMLEALNAIEDKSEEDKAKIKEIKVVIKEFETVIDKLEVAAEEQERLKQPIVTEIENTYNQLIQLISGTKPLIEKAISQIDNIIQKSEAAEPLISTYESLLYSEKEALGEEVFQGLEENLTELKRYTEQNNNGYDFVGMKNILEQDLTILTQTENYLVQGMSELYQENFQSSKSSFTNASTTLVNYKIAGLTLDYSTLVFDNSKQQSPLDTANNLLQAGLTSLVMDPSIISDSELTQETLPSVIAAMSDENTNFLSELTTFFKNSVVGGDSSGMGGLFGSFGDGTSFSSMAGDGINKAAEHFLYQEYLKEHFEMFPIEGESSSEHKPSVLEYEQEYLLVGKRTDMDNISSVISRIIFLRTIFDFVSILGDTAKRDEAKLVASSLVGFTGLPILVSITQVLILLVWSFAEALLDVSALMMGKEVPILKKDVTLEFPELFLLSRSFLQSKASTIADTNELSLSYQDYLRIFLLFKGKKDLAYRSLDLMQENIKIRYNENAFQIQNCMFGFEVNSTFTITEKFTGIAFVKNYLGNSLEEYRFSVRAACSY